MILMVGISIQRSVVQITAFKKIFVQIYHVVVVVVVEVVVEEEVVVVVVG